MKRSLLFTFIALIAPLIMLAQQSQMGFTYQAVVRDLDGKPLSNQPIGVKVTLENDGGTTIYYSETHALTTSSVGVIGLTVGGGNIIQGAFDDTPWASASVFMKVEVDPGQTGSYETLGTTKLMAVPYALFAAAGNPGPEGPQGMPGETGPVGETGADGQSAYEVWLSQGNAGGEQVFLESLIGPEGTQGVGIQETINNGNGTFTLIFSNSSTFTTGNLTGPKVRKEHKAQQVKTELMVFLHTKSGYRRVMTVQYPISCSHSKEATAKMA